MEAKRLVNRLSWDFQRNKLAGSVERQRIAHGGGVTDYSDSRAARQESNVG